MQHLLAVGLGGFCGAICRYALAGWMQRRFPAFTPAGTLLVNVLGCFVIGLLIALLDRKNLSPALQPLLVTGFLGSLTTFSAFGYETFELLREQDVRKALLNVAGNLALGLAAVWVGWTLASR